MVHLINDAAHWRERANKMRALAEGVEDHDARVSMLRNADDYDNLASRIQERMAEPPRSRQEKADYNKLRSRYRGASLM